MAKEKKSKKKSKKSKGKKAKKKSKKKNKKSKSKSKKSKKNKTKKENKKFYFLSIRYLIALILGISISIFYTIFTPLTIYPVHFLLSIFYETSLELITIIIEEQMVAIKIVEACVAGSAYFLLTLLNLATPMDFKKRIKSLLFLYSTFLIINIIRIFAFAIILTNSFTLFNTLHLITWYFLSGFIVFAVWVANIKVFNINKIPVYNDFKLLVRSIKGKK